MDARNERTWCGQCNAVELWPENLPAVLLYLDCDTQWRYAGLSGAPTGLDYAGVRAAMDLQAIPADQRAALFADLQILERTHLEVAHAKLAKEQAQPAGTPGPGPRRPGR